MAFFKATNKLEGNFWHKIYLYFLSSFIYLFIYLFKIIHLFHLFTVNDRLNALGVYLKIQNFRGRGRSFQNAQI